MTGRRGTRWVVGVLVGFAMLAAPAAAEAGLSWSAPVSVAPHASGIPLDAVSCATTSQCTAVDGQGSEVTFNPLSPGGAASRTVSGSALLALACPSPTQCTAVDLQGEQVTFDPQSPGATAPRSIDTSGVPLSLACPSTTQCTAVDGSGGEVTFNPQSGRTVSTSASLDSGQTLVGVDCPVAAQCSAIDTKGQAVTFDPQSATPGTRTTVTGSIPAAISCRSTSLCAVVDSGGGEETFGQHGQGSTTIDGNGSSAVALSGLSCASESDCVAVDVHGNAIRSDPASLQHSTPAAIDRGGVLISVSCPGATQCTAVDTSGREVTFDPAAPGTATPVAIDGTTTLTSVACPAAVQCTAVDVSGTEATFAPGSATAPTTSGVDQNAGGVYAVACPTTTQCTAVDINGREVTFNPQSPRMPAPALIDSGHQLLALACPAASQCTATDDLGREVTFDPQAPGGPAQVPIETGHALPSIACPSSGQCTATDDSGDEITFDPKGPGRPVVSMIDTNPAGAVACPSTTQCTAVDSAGQEVTFDPHSPAGALSSLIDPNNQLNAVTCRTATDCVAVDGSGRVAEGDPRAGGWSIQQLGAGGSLSGLSCPSVLECVAVDRVGDAFLGASGPLPPVPVALTRPMITGKATQGSRLFEIHARWVNAPTSYVYQWERCRAGGASCTPIAGATGQAYTLGRADVGHTLRVTEAGANIAGTGSARASAATLTVRPLVAVAASRTSLSGVSRGRPKLAFTLSAGPREPALKAIRILLPGLVTVARASTAVRAGIVADLGHRRLGFSARLTGRTLMITLRRPAGAVRLGIGYQLIRVSKTVIQEVRRRRVRAVRLILIAIETGGKQTRMKLTVPVS